MKDDKTFYCRFLWAFQILIFRRFIYSINYYKWMLRYKSVTDTKIYSFLETTSTFAPIIQYETSNYSYHIRKPNIDWLAERLTKLLTNKESTSKFQVWSALTCIWITASVWSRRVFTLASKTKGYRQKANTFWNTRLWKSYSYSFILFHCDQYSYTISTKFPWHLPEVYITFDFM